MGKILALINLFRVGESLDVTSATAWKNGAIKVGAFATFLGVVVVTLRAFGVNVPDISPDQLNTIAEGVLSGVTMFITIVHIVSSDKVGILPALPAPSKALDPTGLPTNGGAGVPSKPAQPIIGH